MKAKTFFTDSFYADQHVVVNILNDLLEADLILEKDFYGNGSFLFGEVWDRPEAREILGKVISDFDAYWKKNNKDFVKSKSNIPLCLLIEEHGQAFKSTIMWDDKVECFYTEED